MKLHRSAQPTAFLSRFFPNEFIGRHLYLTGEYERSIVEILLKFSKPGDVLLDIGANIGYVSACFLNKVPRSRVIAVEPQPQIVDILRSNLKSFGDERYTVFPVGVSDIDSSGWLEICDWNRGASKVVKERSSQSVEIELWSARRFFASIRGENVDLVKIDVEGHEEIVLKACEAELNSLRPRAILFENQTRSAAPDGAIGRILRNIGYQVSGVKKSFMKLDLVPVSTAADCVYNDYLAVRV